MQSLACTKAAKILLKRIPADPTGALPGFFLCHLITAPLGGHRSPWGSFSTPAPAAIPAQQFRSSATGAVSVWEGSGVLQPPLCRVLGCTSLLALGSPGTFAGGTRPPLQGSAPSPQPARWLQGRAWETWFLLCLLPEISRVPAAEASQDCCGLVDGQAAEQVGQQLCWRAVGSIFGG